MGASVFFDNVVIITGASSGIGRELAHQLAAEGARLALASRNAARLEEVAVECRELGGTAMAVPTDIGDETRCKSLIDATVAEYGRIDTLINNAGYGMQGKLEDLPDLNGFRALINANLLGSVYCTYYALPHIMRTKGRIVAVSSVSGKIGSPGNTAYCASKFGMAGFFDSLRLEMKQHDVSVTVIYPGFVVTEFAERVVKPDGTPVGEAGRKMYTKYMMSAKTCASIIIGATAERRRSAVLSFEGKIGVWMNNNFPGIVDSIIFSFFKARKKRLEKNNVS